MLFEDLIRGLGEKLGAEFVVEDGSCTLGVDDMIVSLLNLPEVDAIAITGEIGEPPPQGLAELYRTMLAANHLFAGTAGATISIDEEKNRFQLCRLDRLATVDVDGYFQIMERFVNTLETWRKMLADYRPSTDAASSDSVSRPDDDFGAQRLGSSFMSV